jgi:hypothetical protein
LRGPLPGFQAVRPGNKFSPAAPTTHIHYRRMPEIRQSKSLIQSSSQFSESRRTAGWEKGDGGLGFVGTGRPGRRRLRAMGFVVTLPERFHASCVDGRICESSRVTSETRPASYLQKTGGFYIAAGAHRFSQRSFLAEDGRSRFVVSHPSQSTQRIRHPATRLFIFSPMVSRCPVSLWDQVFFAFAVEMHSELWALASRVRI